MMGAQINRAQIRTLVIVSSKTGNTRKIARAMVRGLEGDAVLRNCGDEVDFAAFDLVLVGFWLDSGHVDEKALEVLKTLKGKKTGIFGTLGGNPASPEAQKVLKSACDALLEGERGNTLIGTYMCRGKISAEVLELMNRMFPKLKDDPKHLERIRTSSTHPDARDRYLAGLCARRWQGRAARLALRTQTPEA